MNTTSYTSCQKLRKSRYLALSGFALFFHFIPNTLSTIVDTLYCIIAGLIKYVGREVVSYFIQML